MAESHAGSARGKDIQSGEPQRDGRLMWPRPAEGDLPAGCGGNRRGDRAARATGLPRRVHQLGSVTPGDLRGRREDPPARGEGVNMPAVTAGLRCEHLGAASLGCAAGAPGRAERAGWRGPGWAAESPFPLQGSLGSLCRRPVF